MSFAKKKSIARRAAWVFALTALGTSPLAAADRIVSPGGGPGRYGSIQSAMDAAAIGDRILVLPGQYPGFTVTKSIAVIGLGSAPGDVRVGPIAFHPIFPHAGYDVQLSRMEVHPEVGESLVLSGNELGSGDLAIDSLDVNGGVFLGAGEEGFFVAMNNSIVIAETGQGYQGAAVTIGGPNAQVEMSRSEIRGAAGSLFPAFPPLAALAIDESTTVRLSQTTLSGGSGAAGQTGGAGLVVRGTARVPAVHGNSRVEGGTGGSGAAGGPAFRSDRPVYVGSAVVLGGTGTPNGPQLSGTGAILPLDTAEPQLELTIDGHARGPVEAGSGTLVSWRLDTRGRAGAIALATELVPFQIPGVTNLLVNPAQSVFLPTSLDFQVPASLGYLSDRVFHSQGITVDVATADFRATTPATLRL